MTGVTEFRKYGNPSGSSPRDYTMPSVGSFGDTVNQAVVHPSWASVAPLLSFGGTVN